MTLTRVWMLLAGLLLIVAAVLLWRNNLSTAFVTAALGACAWFLSHRTQLRATTESQEEEPDEEWDEPSDES